MRTKQSVSTTRGISWFTLIVFFVFSIVPFPGQAAVIQTVGVDGRIIYTTDSDTTLESANFDQVAGAVWEFNLLNGNLNVNVNSDHATTWAGRTDIYGGILGIFNAMGFHTTNAAEINLHNADFIGAAMRLTDQGTLNSLKLQGDANGGYALNEGKVSGIGNVAFLGRAVENKGTIDLPLNKVTLGAGDAMTVGLSGDNLVSVVVDEATSSDVRDFANQTLKDQIANSGNITGHKITLDAKGIDSVFEKAINLKGEIKAVDVDMNDRGELALLSLDDVYNKAILNASKIYIRAGEGNISTLGSVRAKELDEKGASFNVGGIFEVEHSRHDNLDHAFTYVADTDVSGTRDDVDDIIVNEKVNLNMTGDMTFNAGTDGVGAFTMNDTTTSTITGNNHNLTISAASASTLGSISGVGTLTFSSATGSDVTFTSPSAAAFSVGTVKTNYHSLLARDEVDGGGNHLIFSDSNAVGGLQDMSNHLEYNYKLANNIDASETSSWNSGAGIDGFNPIGNSFSNPFIGKFDGQNHTIDNLFIYRPSTDLVGLFGYVNGAANLGAATIQNVGLSSMDIRGQNRVGGLVGHNHDGSITNSYARGTVSGSGDYVGGLAGASSSFSSITNSYARGAVSGSGNYVGGLVGSNYSSSIANSYASGTVSGSGDYVGGLVGDNNLSSIVTSYANVAVNGHGLYAGGLAGISISSSIDNSYASGTVTGDYVGGLVGGSYDTSITNSFSTGVATSGVLGISGGLIGLYSSGQMTNNWWFSSNSDGVGSGSPSGTKANGVSDFYNPAHAVYSGWDFDADGVSAGHNGDWIMLGDGLPHLQMEWSANISTLVQLQMIALDLDASYTLANNVDASATLAWNSGAGFNPIGNFTTPFTGTFDGQNHTVDNLFINRPSTNEVGLFGRVKGDLNIDATIQNVGLNNVNITGGIYVGSLVGNNVASNITNSSATGDVSGWQSLGGLVGSITSFTDVFGQIFTSTIESSYAAVNVSGTSNLAGGLVGSSYGLGTFINNSYATGNVNSSGGENIGGLLGFNQLGVVTNSYARGNVHGTGAVGGLVGFNNYFSLINNGYATGNVSGSNSNGTSQDIGGLVGLNQSSAVVSNSFATGSVSGDLHLGGLVGTNNNGATIDNSYYTDANNQNGNGTFESGGATAFLGSGHAVYSGWTFGEGQNWNSFTSNLPRLDYEWAPTITTLLQLQNMNLNLGASYTLTNDIDATATQLWNYDGSGSRTDSSNYYGFNPIGNSPTNFTGSFDGNSHTITNLTINRPTTDGVGLFGATLGDGLDNGADIQNIGLINAHITGKNYVGGLVGLNDSGFGINNSYASGSISGGYNVGGLVGYNWSSSIANSYASGSVSGTGNGVGGLVGFTSNSIIVNSYATGSVSGNSSVGGLVATSNYTSIIDSYASGSVSGNSFIGGLVAYSLSSSIANSYAVGSVNGNGNYVGGLLAVNDSSTIDKSYASGIVSGSGNFVGGLAGSNYLNSSITNSYASGSVSGGNNYVGGLIGYNVYTSSIANSYASGSVSGRNNYVGGLVGFEEISSSVANSYASGSVSGSNYVGGLVGGNDDSSITNSYAVGAVTGVSSVGGLIGTYVTGVLTNNWWFDSLSNGLGNSVTNQIADQYQKATAASDFNSTSHQVYQDSDPGAGNNAWDFTNVWAVGGSFADLRFEYNVWTGAASNAWSDALNWSKGALTSTSKIIFNGAHTADSSIDSSFGGTIKKLFIDTGYTGTITSNKNLAINGEYVQKAGAFDADANDNTVTVAGHASVAGGNYKASSSATQTFNGGLTVSGGTFTGSTGAVDVNGNVTLSSGTLTAPSANFTVSGNWNKTGGTFAAGNSAVTFDGTSGTQILTAGVSFGNFNNISHAGASTLQLATNNLNVDGALTNFAGTFDANGKNVSVTGVTEISGGVYQAKSGTQTFNGGLNIDPSGRFIGSTGGVNVNGDLNIIGGNYTGTTGALNVTGNALLSSANFTVTGGTLNVTGNLLVQGQADDGSNNSHANSILTVQSGGNLIVGGNLSLLGGDGAVYTANSTFRPGSATLNLSGSAAAITGNVIVAGGLGGSGLLPLNIGPNAYLGGNATLTQSGSSSMTIGGNLSVLGGAGGYGNRDYSNDPYSTNPAPGPEQYSGGNATLTQGASASMTIGGNLSVLGGAHGDINNAFSGHGGTAAFTGGSLVDVRGDFAALDDESALNYYDPQGFATFIASTNMKVGGSFSTNSYSLSGQNTFDAHNGTLEFNGTADQTIGDVQLYNILHSGTGTLLLSHDLYVVGTLTNSNGLFETNDHIVGTNGLVTVSGGTLNAGSATQTYNGGLTVSGGTFSGSLGSVVVSGNLTLSSGTLIAPSVMQVSGNWAKTGGTYTAGTGTVTFNKTFGTQTLNSGGADFKNIIHSGAGTLQLITNDLNATGTLRNSTGIFNANTKNVSVAGLTMVLSNSTYTGSTGTNTFNGGLNMTGGTVSTTGGGSVILGNNVTTNASAAKSTINGNLDLGGATRTFTTADGSAALDLEIAAAMSNGSITKLGSGAMALSGANTYSGTTTISAGTLQIGSGGATGTLGSGAVVDNAALVFNRNNALTVNNSISGTGTVTKSGNGTMTLNGSNTYTGLTTISAGTLLQGGALAYAGALTVSNGTYDANGQNTTVAGLTTVSGGTYLAKTGTQTYNGGLTVSGGTYTGSTGLMDVNGNFTQSGGTVNANAETMRVSGNWNHNSGTFNAGTSSVILDGTNQTVFGSTTFNNFNKTVSSADTLTFEAGTTQTVNGALTLTGGGAGKLLSLRSTSNATPAARWNLNAQGIYNDTQYANVKDLNNVRVRPLSFAHSVDSGNNLNVSFPSDPVTEVIPVIPSAGTGDVPISFQSFGNEDWIDNDKKDKYLEELYRDLKITVEQRLHEMENAFESKLVLNEANL